MATMTEKCPSPPSDVPPDKPMRLATWKEAREYFSKHLTPIRYSPNGRPIYSNDEIKALNILLPDEAE